MDTELATSFSPRETEVIYAAIDHYEKHVQDYINNYPLVPDGSRDPSSTDLVYLVERIETVKQRLEKIIALGKAVGAR